MDILGLIVLNNKYLEIYIYINKFTNILNIVSTSEFYNI